MIKNYDLIVLGAGITGLSVARQKLSDEPYCKILIIEKECKKMQKYLVLKKL